ncbi:hypothetical protein [Lihuaxuella thermophila]|uniref:Uncharacterized protein n=1 Tax=Lihuaxuella thermophila TaxID=1173111 RepID=A0A1H8JLP0_9BACL|nr:hypothetical protein [Lihuaxuella thermophila]SEN81227.1 hypothetical protein SAMN05444955_1288 [Lihuaxuella thermophila]
MRGKMKLYKSEDFTKIEVMMNSDEIMNFAHRLDDLRKGETRFLLESIDTNPQIQIAFECVENGQIEKLKWDFRMILISLFFLISLLGIGITLVELIRLLFTI